MMIDVVYLIAARLLHVLSRSAARLCAVHTAACRSLLMLLACMHVLCTYHLLPACILR